MGNEPENQSVAAPAVFYYMAIDGSPAVDSAVFCAQLEAHQGWRNLVKDFLRPAQDDARRLDDPFHPFLPICLYKQDGRDIAVVSPGGRDSTGGDKFWKTYPGYDPITGARDELGEHDWGGPTRVTYGRHTAAEESARYMNQLILCPQVQVLRPDTGPDAGKVIAHLRDAGSPPVLETFAADLLYVSSHGWLGGFAGGFTIQKRPDAEPPKAIEPYNPSYYYSVGGYAFRGRGFEGPKWVVLAQCSTVNSATWALWARVLAKSNPHVRGILAYEEASPLPEEAASIAKAFFAQLDKGTSFVDAWREANKGDPKKGVRARHWAAIVHKDAVNDRLDRWADFADLASVETTDKISNYLGFMESAPRGEAIFDIPAPFGFSLKRLVQGSFREVNYHNLDGVAAIYDKNSHYQITIAAPTGQTIDSATIRWVHIRETNHHQPSFTQLFAKYQGTDANPKPQKGGKELLIEPAVKNSQSEMTIELTAPTAILDPKIEAHHSYFWPHVALTTTSGETTDHDFKTVGLLYYGPCDC